MSDKAIKNGFFGCVLKGVIFSLVIALVGILIFAGIIKLCKLDGVVIKAVNQFIKIVSLFLGILFSAKEGKGLLKGLIIGILFSLIIHLIFLIIGGEFLTSKFLTDLLLCALVGAILGVGIVNLRKKN